MKHNKKNILKALTGTIMCLTLIGIVTMGTVFAQTGTSKATGTTTDTATTTPPADNGLHRGRGGPERMFGKDIVRTVTNLDNGVQITMTSTDTATVKLLQQREQNPGRHGQGQMAPPVNSASQQ